MSRLLGQNFNKDLFFFKLLPFAKFDIEIYISKNVTARSSKVGQLIEGNE